MKIEVRTTALDKYREVIIVDDNLELRSGLLDKMEMYEYAEAFADAAQQLLQAANSQPR